MNDLPSDCTKPTLGGAWGASCFNGFWGYYQPIRDAAKSNWIAKFSAFGNASDFETYSTTAQRVTSNSGIGGQGLDTPSDWATLLSETATANVWQWAAKIQNGGSPDAALKITYVEGSNTRIFLVLTQNQNKKVPGCNDTYPCNITQFVNP